MLVTDRRFAAVVASTLIGILAGAAIAGPDAMAKRHPRGEPRTSGSCSSSTPSAKRCCWLP